MTRRSTFAALAAALMAPLAARAQGGATNAPAGGIPSTTAPSNSQGTPAGGTGIVGGTRVGPGGATMPASPSTPLVGGEPGTSESTPRTRRRRRRRTRRHTTPTNTTPQ